ncbi:MAG: prolipoprotein diacylglyceryl transferase [Beijerinckiaceae bacterium]
MAFFALPFPAISPNLIELGPLVIRWYALAYVVGLFFGWWYAGRLIRNDRLWATEQPRPDAVRLDDLLLWCALGVVLGGRIGEVLFYNLPYYAQNPGEILQVWQGGMSFHGGLIGCALAGIAFAHRTGGPKRSTLDVLATVAPVGLFLGRIANFINDELWGRPTDVPWAVVFPRGGNVPRHPSQLYEAATEGLLLFLFVAWLVRRYGFRRPGLIAGWFGIGYAVARFGCEFFREPDAQQGYLLGGWLTMGMVLCIPMALIGAWLVATARPAPAGAQPA